MSTIHSTAAFSLPPHVRHAFYSLESSATLSAACDIHSECIFLVQHLLDSGQITFWDYVFYTSQLAYRLESVQRSFFCGDV